MTDFRLKFGSALDALPAPGGGGCHTALLGAANFAALAGIPEGEAVETICASIPSGGRRVSVREVQDAVRKAYRDCENAPQGEFAPYPRVARVERPALDTARFWRDTQARWPEDTDPLAELWERSPVRLDWPAEEDTGRLLAALYGPDEWIYIGGAKEPGTLGGNIRRVSDWLAHFQEGGEPGPHIIPNPLTGREGPTKDGGTTLRGDSCVVAWRFVVVEFDNISKHEQAAFWLSAPLPVMAVLDSGNKSLHGWVRVDCADATEWEREVEHDAFPNLLVPLGADRACKNESRMSRTPGVLRDNGNWQRLLYLNPDAGRVAP